MTIPESKQDRAARRATFLAACGRDPASAVFVAGDASPRTYYRVAAEDRTVIVMDDPPPGEIPAFVTLGRFLAAQGLSVPAVLAEDRTNGFLLLEDFGDASYGRVLTADPAQAGPLYALATDALCRLHDRLDDPTDPLPEVPPYDQDFLSFEVSLFCDWFLPAVGQPLSAPDRQAFLDLWTPLFRHLEAGPQTLVLRDFHVDNLMVLAGRDGTDACGFLDFQSARRGPLPYDLMSLMEDARRDIDPALRQAMQDRYLAARPTVEADTFRRDWAICAAQRHTKVIGGFVRTWQRDGKPHYLGHLPRVWELLDRALSHPDLMDIRAWFDDHAPTALRQRKLQ